MKLFNSYTNNIEEFKSINPNEVSIYVCGPTVYNYIHIGNSRPIIVFDMLARFLKHNNYKIKFVQNFTDIDDKIIKRSNEENLSFKEITEKYINAFMEDISKLNILDDVIRPKVSDNIDEIINMIKMLIDNNFAYISDGDVLFRVNKFKEYGKLSNQKINDLEIGNRIEIDNKKENPLDFVLWKKKKDNEPYWKSPFSNGRPGWHIECSALSKKYLGENFDIHAGGIDLIFPHHENEIAQSKCCNINSNFANYWLHNGYVEIDGEKMSKSKGNFTLLRDILKIYDGNIVRFFILQTHYRKPINFSEFALENAKKSLENISNSIIRYEKISNKNIKTNTVINEIVDKFEIDFNNSLSDDLNTSSAIAAFFELIKNINKILIDDTKFNLDKVVEKMRYFLEEVLGVKIMDNKISNIEEKLIKLLCDIRDEARCKKNYELSDKIRDELNKLGIKLNDGRVK